MNDAKTSQHNSVSSSDWTGGASNNETAMVLTTTTKMKAMATAATFVVLLAAPSFSFSFSLPFSSSNSPLPSQEPQQQQPQGRPFGLSKIDHVVIRCRNFRSMYDFYTNVLGCTVDDDGDAVGRFGGALTHLRVGGAAMIDLLSYDYADHLTEEGRRRVPRMHLSGRRRPNNDNKSSGNGSNDSGPSAAAGVLGVEDLANRLSSDTSTMDHLCLRVDPFDEREIRRHFERNDVPVVASGDRRKGAEGIGPSVYVSDPEGNVIELKGPSWPSSSSSAAAAIPEQTPSPSATTSSFQKQKSQLHTESIQSRDDASSTTTNQRSFGGICGDDSRKKEEFNSREASTSLPLSAGVIDAAAAAAAAVTTKAEAEEEIPITPCVRICRYNGNFYDGQVCIGCYRDAYEVGTWTGMADKERYYALLDAADRAAAAAAAAAADSSGPGGDKRDAVLEDSLVEDDGPSPSHVFDGAICREELLRQATAWKNRAEEKETQQK